MRRPDPDDPTNDPLPAPPLPMTLFLARHGQSEWNNSGRVTGQLDPALSATGEQQAQALARCLQGVPLRAIYCSTLQRTAQTAAPAAAASGLPMLREAALDEIHMGVLQGRYRDERDAEAQILWTRFKGAPWADPVPGAEAYASFVQRVRCSLGAILRRHAGHSVLVVAHAATNRVLLGTLLGWPKERWLDLKPRNKHCYRVQLGEHGAASVDTFVLSGSRTGVCEPGLVA